MKYGNMKMPLPFLDIMLSTAKTASLIIWQQISASKAEQDIFNQMQFQNQVQ